VGVLQRFERRLGGIVEGAFARVFKGAVEPVEVVTALQREAADNKRVLAGGRVLVPNSYVVALSPKDHENFASYGAPLAGEIARSVREEIAEQGWTTFGPVSVELEKDGDLDTGVFRVHSAVESQDQRDDAQGRAATGARLVGDDGHAYPLRPGTTLIGRSEDAQVRLPDVGTSRRHAEVRFDGVRAVLADLGSTNGTLVNGGLAREQELRDGDRVQVGSTVLTFRMDG